MLIPVHKCKYKGPQGRYHASVIAYALVDSDMQHLSQHFWTLSGRDGTKYVRTQINGKAVFMHHMVIGRPADGLQTSHKNGNPLDNQRENLQHTTQSVNKGNMADGPYRRHGRNAAGLPRNVYRNPYGFTVYVRKNKVAYYGGIHADVESAIKARDALRERLGV